MGDSNSQDSVKRAALSEADKLLRQCYAALVPGPPDPSLGSGEGHQKTREVHATIGLVPNFNLEGLTLVR